MCVDKLRVQHYIVKPPYPKSDLSPKAIKANDWVEAFYVGIHWEDGFIEYDELPRLINNNTQQYAILLAKGKDKADYLTGVVGRHVINLENLGCPSLKTLEGDAGSCLQAEHRDTGLNCALRNAHRIVLWCAANKGLVNLTEIDARAKTFDGFPIPHVHPLDLAAAGFYYVMRENYCQCVYCSLTVRSWDSEEIPIEVHKHWNPRCAYVCQVDTSNDTKNLASSLRNTQKEVWRYSTTDPHSSCSVEPSKRRYL